MNDESMREAMATWAARDLPARLDVAETSKLLGFAEHDIQILMAVGKLTPLGDPAPNAPKWFAAVEMIRLATDEDWLHKATKEISKYWRHKRERRSDSFRPGKVTPNSSPKVSPGEQFGGGSRAVRSGEQEVEKVA